MVSNPSAASGSHKSHSIHLPLAALAVDGVKPAQGDRVTVTVEGTLGGIDGEKGMLTIESINGEPVEAPKSEPTDEDVMAEAEKADGMGY